MLHLRQLQSRATVLQALRQALGQVGLECSAELDAEKRSCEVWVLVRHPLNWVRHQPNLQRRIGKSRRGKGQCENVSVKVSEGCKG